MSIKKKMAILVILALTVVVALSVATYAEWETQNANATGDTSYSSHGIDLYGYNEQLNNEKGLNLYYWYWQYKSEADMGVEVRYRAVPHVEGDLLTTKYTLVTEFFYGKILFWNNTDKTTGMVTYDQFVDASNKEITGVLRGS